MERMLMMEWIFSGIGTEILSFIIGAFGGGIVGYKIGISNKAKQEQKAKTVLNNSNV